MNSPKELFGSRLGNPGIGLLHLALRQHRLAARRLGLSLSRRKYQSHGKCYQNTRVLVH